MKLILFSTLILAACAAEESRTVPPNDTSESVSPLNGDDNEEQGRFLLGRNADQTSGTYHFWVGKTGIKGNETVTVTVSPRGTLAATHANGLPFTDDDFVGMQFNVGTHPVKIDDVTVSETGDVTYRLFYDPGNGNWTDYCVEERSLQAVPMKGRWTLERDHLDGTDITFACMKGGVAAKCIEWGYPPGNVGPTDFAWKLHRTCTQHASAVYCNNGVARTRELTPIAIRDWVDGRKPAPDEDPVLPVLDPTRVWPPPDEFYVEGAWRYDEPVMCLSKLRWSSLPPGGYCPRLVPDPRTLEGRADGGRFCDELSVDQLHVAGAEFITGSELMDLAMYLWESPSGELVSTGSGYVENGTAVTTPFAAYEGYQLSSSASTQRYVIVRNLPGSLTLADVTPVYSQQTMNKSDRVVAPVNALGQGVTSNHVVDFTRPEGYLLNDYRDNLLTLWLFEKNGDYVTAIANPGGYTPVRSLGYVLP
jgi:hypothetical protein